MPGAWTSFLPVQSRDVEPRTHPWAHFHGAHTSNSWLCSVPGLVPPLHMRVPRSSVPPLHDCSPLPRVRPGLTCMCPACCQPSTESGRVCLPLAPGVDGWVCFPCVFWVQGEKKNISQMSFSWGAFPSFFFFFFSAQVSLKGTSLSVSNSFALNSSESFARAV